LYLAAHDVALGICTSAAGFDRATFDERINQAVVGFFTKTLG
jgi:predicted dienelactone hydrolase